MGKVSFSSQDSAQVTKELDTFVGGSGGISTKGLVPASPSDDGVGSKVLADDGTWVPNAASGGENLTSMGALIATGVDKTPPVDADFFSIRNSVGGLLAKVSWVNIKATLLTYFNPIYQAILISGTNIKTINSSSILGAGDLVVGGDVTLAGIQTLTNKTINRRIETIVQSATIAVDTFANDLSIVTGLAQNPTISNLGAVSANHFEYALEITDNGISRLLTFAPQFEAGDSALPTATIPSERLYIKFRFNTVTNRHACVWFGNPAKTVSLAGLQTLTNKRITARISTVASGATHNIVTDSVDSHLITALDVDMTGTGISIAGAPTNQQKLIVSITALTLNRTLIWNPAFFESSGSAVLPTLAVAGVRLDVGLIYNTATSKFRCIAVA